MYLLFKQQDGILKSKNNASDKFSHENIQQFVEAIDQYTKKDIFDDIKAGLKQNILYLIRRSAKILKGKYLIENQGNLAVEIDNFLCILHISENYIFADAPTN